MHYRTQCCGTDPIKLDLEDYNLSGLISQYIRELFEDRVIDEAKRLQLIEKYSQILTEAITKGYPITSEFYDADLAKQLKENITRFSAFKETSFKNSIEGMLTENGKLLSFKEFKKQALEVSEDYNKRWLRTEYDQTVSSANMANKWKSFEANTDLYPNIRYQTVGDGRVREKHQQWDGTVLPFDHSFWNTHLPPNDWGCRCTIMQTDAPVSKGVASGRVKKGFNTNSGKKGEIFKESPYEETLSNAERRKAEAMADKLKKQTK